MNVSETFSFNGSEFTITIPFEMLARTKDQIAVTPDRGFQVALGDGFTISQAFSGGRAIFNLDPGILSFKIVDFSSDILAADETLTRFSFDEPKIAKICFYSDLTKRTLSTGEGKGRLDFYDRPSIPETQEGMIQAMDESYVYRMFRAIAKWMAESLS